MLMRLSPRQLLTTTFAALSAFAIGLSAHTMPAAAQAEWLDGQPIFRSDPRPSYFPQQWQQPAARPAPPRQAIATPTFRQYPELMSGGPQPLIQPKEPETVAFANKEAPGTIIIDTEARKLYLTQSNDSAFMYPISVGREGFTWRGTEKVSRIAAWPDWHPPKEMRERQPGLPVKMTGGLKNPLGAKAIYLGKTLYRIHGTNDPKTIGRAASSGCFRMLNAHVVHLAGLVDIGATVKVVDRWPANPKLAQSSG